MRNACTTERSFILGHHTATPTSVVSNSSMPATPVMVLPVSPDSR